MLHNQFIATLAQLVEHLTCNEDVVGSIPTGGSIFVSGYSAVWLVHSLWERRVTGSNPVIPTTCPHRLVRSGHRVFIPATGVRISVWMPFFYINVYVYKCVYTYNTIGDVAQLEEHLICIQKVVGSIPSISTNFKGASK